MATETDDPKQLLTRSDAALYSAKSAGRDRVYYHNGEEIQPVVQDAVQVLSETEVIETV